MNRWEKFLNPISWKLESNQFDEEGRLRVGSRTDIVIKYAVKIDRNTLNHPDEGKWICEKCTEDVSFICTPTETPYGDINCTYTSEKHCSSDRDQNLVLEDCGDLAWAPYKKYMENKIQCSAVINNYGCEECPDEGDGCLQYTLVGAYMRAFVKKVEEDDARYQWSPCTIGCERNWQWNEATTSIADSYMLFPKRDTGFPNVIKYYGGIINENPENDWTCLDKQYQENPTNGIMFKNLWGFETDDEEGNETLTIKFRVGYQIERHWGNFFNPPGLLGCVWMYWGYLDVYNYKQREITLIYDPEYVWYETDNDWREEWSLVSPTPTPNLTATVEARQTLTKVALEKTQTASLTEIETLTLTPTLGQNTPSPTITPTIPNVSSVVYAVEEDALVTSKRLRVTYSLTTPASVRMVVKDLADSVIYDVIENKQIGNNYSEWNFGTTKPWEYTLQLFVDGVICKNTEDNIVSYVARVDNTDINVKFSEQAKTNYSIVFTPVAKSNLYRNPTPGVSTNGGSGGFKESDSGTDLYYPTYIDDIYLVDTINKYIFQRMEATPIPANRFIYYDEQDYSTTQIGSYGVQQIQRMLNVILTTKRNLELEGVFPYTRIALDGWWRDDTANALKLFMETYLSTADYNEIDDILWLYSNLSPQKDIIPSINNDEKYILSKQIIKIIHNQAKIYDNLIPYEENSTEALYQIIHSIAQDTSIRPNQMTLEEFATMIKAILQQESKMVHMRSLGEITLSYSKCRGYGQISSVCATDTRLSYLDINNWEEEVYQSKKNLGQAARYLALLFKKTYISSRFAIPRYAGLSITQRVKITAACYNYGEGAVMKAYEQEIGDPETDSSRDKFSNAPYNNNIEVVLEKQLTSIAEVVKYVKAIGVNSTDCENCTGYTQGNYKGYYEFYKQYPIKPFQDIDFGRIKQ